MHREVRAVTHDLVIRGGTVVDGSGDPRFTADVAVDGTTITEVGRVEGRGRRELSADGLIVAPGWVDIHTHYDGQVLWDPLLEPSSSQGVTTVLLGNCGVGFAPAHPEHREWLIGLMEGVEDIPAPVLDEGIDWGWESFDQYLDVLDDLPLAIDIATQIPHAALRVFVMGQRGQEHGIAATSAEIEEMSAEVERAIRAGALGFSTSRSIHHVASDGRLTPSYGVSVSELTGIARALSRVGRGVVELAADLVDLDEEFAVLRAIAEAGRCGISVGTVQYHERDPAHYRRLLALMERANANGVAVRGQVCARPPGVIMALDGSQQPLLESSTYRSLAGLPLPARVRELRRSEVRAQILDELAVQDPSTSLLYGKHPYVFALGTNARYGCALDDSIAAIAARTGRSREEVAYDMLVSDEGRGVLWAPASNFLTPNFDVTRELLVHPYTLPGVGDGGAHCRFICDTSFPTFLLTHWVRDAEPDQRLGLESVIKQQCADTAAWVGLDDRGVLSPGRKADINVIDLDALAIDRPEIRSDFPLGGKRLVQGATGYRTTIVAGEVVMDDSQHTGALPGRLARGGAR